jgi:hypothetical protein
MRHQLIALGDYAALFPPLSHNWQTDGALHRHNETPLVSIQPGFPPIVAESRTDTRGLQAV